MQYLHLVLLVLVIFFTWHWLAPRIFARFGGTGQ